MGELGRRQLDVTLQVQDRLGGPWLLCQAAKTFSLGARDKLCGQAVSPWLSQPCRVSTAAGFLFGEMLKYNWKHSANITQIIHMPTQRLDVALIYILSDSL